MDQMKLLVSIVERGHGVAMQRLYGKYQLFLHLQCAGRGTATSEIMDILGLGSTEKDVVLSFASQAPRRRPAPRSGQRPAGRGGHLGHRILPASERPERNVRRPHRL